MLKKAGSESGEQGWCSSESTCLPPVWPGFESWRRRHMWVEFVVGSLPCSERFFSGYSGFPLSLKTNTFKIPIRSGMHGHVSMSSYKLLSDPWVNKLQLNKLQLQLQKDLIKSFVVNVCNLPHYFNMIKPQGHSYLYARYACAAYLKKSRLV